MNYHDWIKRIGVNVVKSAGDNIYFFKRAGTDLGLLGVLFEGQLKKGPWCDRLGQSKHFTEVCKAIYDNLAATDNNLKGMGEIQQVLIGAALIAGRRPRNKAGTASYDTNNGQAFDSLPLNSIYQSAYEAGFKVGLLPEDMLAALDACKKDNSKWRVWFQNTCQADGIKVEAPYRFLPTKEDADAAEWQLRNSGNQYGLETVLDQIEINFKKTDKILEENWRDATKHKIPIWFNSKAGESDVSGT